MVVFVSSIIAICALLCIFGLVIWREDRRQKLVGRLLVRWAQGVVKLFGISTHEQPLTWELGATPRMIIANHISYLDLVILLSRGVPCLFLGKAEIRSWPLIGFVAKASGMIFVKRGSLFDRAKALIDVQKKLSQGFNVVVFPEGTTSLEGPLKRRGQFFSGAFRAARMSERPIEVLYLDYEDQESCAWLGDQPFVEHLWSFLKIPLTRVRLRSKMFRNIATRSDQRIAFEATRQWMLDGGRKLTYL